MVVCKVAFHFPRQVVPPVRAWQPRGPHPAPHRHLPPVPGDARLGEDGAGGGDGGGRGEGQAGGPGGGARHDGGRRQPGVSHGGREIVWEFERWRLVMLLVRVYYLPLYGNKRCMKTYFFWKVLGPFSFNYGDSATASTACRLH